MKILFLTMNESCYESKRLQEEMQKKGILFLAVKPEEFHEELNEFNAVLIRSIQGQTKKAKEIASKAVKQGLAVVDEKIGKDLGGTKYRNHLLFEKAGIPVPKTFLLPKALRKLNEFKSKELVIKPVAGKQGKGVLKIRNSKTELENFIKKIPIEKRKKFMVSEFLKIEKEFRAFIIGENIAGAFEKISDSWIHNVSQGAEAKEVKLSKEAEMLALNSACAVFNEISGVDIAQTKKGLFVLEANRAPGFEGLEKATGKNIAKEIIEYLEKKTKINLSV
ncbi:MAG: RimK family alpha-L-glutamate ligase [Candidatus Diapherotrites archaeon]